MGDDVSGFVFTRRPDWNRLEELPPELGLTGYQYPGHNVWLLDAWRWRPGKRWPMTGYLPESYTAKVPLPAETLDLLRQLGAVATVLANVRPLDGLSAVSWSAAISATLGTELLFYAANDESLNMAIRWNQGRLESLRLSTHEFLFTNNGPASLVLQHTVCLEDDPPWECPPEITEVLRAIPGLTFGETLTSEEAPLLHSNPIALWPPEVASALGLLGIGGVHTAGNPGEHLRVEFQRPEPSLDGIRPPLELDSILERAQAEAAALLQTNRRLDPYQPLNVLGFDDVDATVLVLAMEEAYAVKIPEAQLVEDGPIDQSLSLSRLAHLVVAAASQPPSASPPPLPSQRSPFQARRPLPRWLWGGLWVLVFALAGILVGLALAGPIARVLAEAGIAPNREGLTGTAKALPFIAAGIGVLQVFKGRLPGTRR